eukprot:167036-Chlamydomonas_euryale.AAC.1
MGALAPYQLMLCGSAGTWNSMVWNVNSLFKRCPKYYTTRCARSAGGGHHAGRTAARRALLVVGTRPNQA